MEFKKFSINGTSYGISGDIDDAVMIEKQYLGDEHIENVSFKDDRVFDIITNKTAEFKNVDAMVLNLALNHTLIIETNSTKPCKVRLPDQEKRYLQQ
jgi:hypothetical protein